MQQRIILQSICDLGRWNPPEAADLFNWQITNEEGYRIMDFASSATAQYAKSLLDVFFDKFDKNPSLQQAGYRRHNVSCIGTRVAAHIDDLRYMDHLYRTYEITTPLREAITPAEARISRQ